MLAREIGIIGDIAVIYKRIMLTQEYLQALVGERISVWRFYVLRHYDWDMSRLYYQIQKDILQTWPDGQARFQPNQRVVFVHDDLDFILDDHSMPFTLYNLQLILRELNVSNCFCRIITNLPRYQEFCDRVARALVNDQPIKAVGPSFWGSCMDGSPNANTQQGYDVMIDSVLPDTKAIQWPYIAQARKTGFHRRYFMSQLWSQDLLSQGIVAYHNAAPDPVGHVDEPLGTAPGCAFLYTQPFSRNNREHVLMDRRRSRELQMFPLDPVRSNCEPQDISSAWRSSFYQHEDIQRALLYVALETTANLCRPFLTRITFKSLVYQRPLLMVGAPGCLALLRELGFQTFDQFWDESYDQEPQLERRVEAVIRVIHERRNATAHDLQQYYRQLEPVLQHNYNHLRNDFVRDQKQMLVLGMQ